MAAAATTGALLGFGLKQGMPARPFNIAASMVLGDAAAGSWGFHPVATPVGVVMHIAGVLLLSVVAAGLGAGRTIRGATVISVIVSLVAGILHLMLAMRLASPGRALTVPQLIVVYLLLAGGLVVGMRLARTAKRVS